MKSTNKQAAIACAFFVFTLFACNRTHADIVISISFDQNSVVSNASIAPGSATTEVYLHFDAVDGTRGNDAGAEFDGFTYVVEAANSGADVPAFFKPITSANLNPLMQTQNWNVVDNSGGGGPNQLAGNVNAPGGSGSRVPFGGFMLAMTLDTSQLDVGDVVSFDPNLFDLASVSDGGNDFGGNGSYLFNTGELSVTAVPEPSSMVILATIGFGIVARRRR